MSEEPSRDPEERASKGRRRFLAGLTIGVGVLASTVAAIPVIGILLSPLRRRRSPEWVPVGSAAGFELGRTVKITFREPGSLPWAGPASRSAAWLRKEGEDRFVVLSAYCTHVGCPTRWAERASLFLCPCHGGAFFPDGSVAAGPPPRPLPLLPVRVERGQVEILPQPLAATTTV